jgi:hypothetical protein
MDHCKNESDAGTDAGVGGELCFAPFDDSRLVRLGVVATQCCMLRV